MSGDYEVGSLTVANVARAYAVIQHLFSAVSFQEWQAATDTDRKRRDWLTVTDTAGAVRGLCYMFVIGHPSSLQMEVPVFASFSLFDERNIARMLFDETREKAREMKCNRIHFWPAGPKGWSIVTNPNRRPPTVGLVYDLQAADDGVPSNNTAKT